MRSKTLANLATLAAAAASGLIMRRHNVAEEKRAEQERPKTEDKPAPEKKENEPKPER